MSTLRLSDAAIAKLWGVQFAVWCALMAACAPVSNTVSTTVGCMSESTKALSRIPTGPVGSSGVVDPNVTAFATAWGSRISALSTQQRGDVGARMNAISRALDDAAAARGVSAQPDQEHLRIQIVLMADQRPDLMTLPMYRSLVDSVEQIPGVSESVGKVRDLIAQGRAFLASRADGVRRGESIIHPNDTVAATATLLEVSDAVTDTAGALATDFTTTTLGDSALADGLSSFAFDSNFAASLTGSTVTADQLRPYLFSYLYAFWANGGSPSYSVNPTCSTDPGSTPANYAAWPGWLVNGVIAGVGNVVAGIITRVQNARATVSLDVSEDMAEGLGFFGIDVAGDFAMGFLYGFWGDLAFVAFFADLAHPRVTWENR